MVKQNASEANVVNSFCLYCCVRKLCCSDIKLVQFCFFIQKPLWFCECFFNRQWTIKIVYHIFSFFLLQKVPVKWYIWKKLQSYFILMNRTLDRLLILLNLVSLNCYVQIWIHTQTYSSTLFFNSYLSNKSYL